MAEGNSESNSLSAGEACLMKYLCLRRRCEQIQLNNERLVNRLQHIRKTIKKMKKERRFLMNKLDEHGDNYKETMLSHVWEESQIFDASSAPLSESTSSMTSATAGAAAASLSVPDSTNVDPAASPASTSKTKKIKTEKEKDPNAPKKPANAFFMFCQQQRANIQEVFLKENDEEISHQEMTKRLAIEWNGLPQEKKKVYYELYEKEKERYEQEMKEYAGSSRGDGKTSEPPVEVKSEPVKL